MKRVIFVISEVGYTWEEVIVPYIEFKKFGFRVDFSTITGNKPIPDPFSVVVRPVFNKFGFGISRIFSPDSEMGLELLSKLDESISIDDIKCENYDAIFLSGGHGSLFDMNKNSALHDLILKFDSMNKKIGAICHATSTLAFINVDGKSLISDKKVTGFPTLQESFILRFNLIHPNFLPLPIWTGKELNKYSTKRNNLIKILEVINPKYTIKDGNIITGVGPKAGRQIVWKML